MNVAEKQAIVMSGGGAYASYEVGILKALVEGRSPATGFSPLAPAIYTGTSSGAINAAVMVSENEPLAGIEALVDVWLALTSGQGKCGNGVFRVRGDITRFFNSNCYRDSLTGPLGNFLEDGIFLASDFFQRGAEFLRSDESLSRRIFELLDFASFISTDLIVRQLQRAVNPQRIRESALNLSITGTNWRTGRPVVFGNRDFTDEIGIIPLASAAAIPGIFPSHMINGEPHVDGTVVENTPLNPAIGAGASVLHVIQNPDPAFFPPDPVPSAIESFYRTIVIMINVLLERDIRHAGEINRGLRLLNQLSQGRSLNREDLEPAARALTNELGRDPGRDPYRPLTIHRYKPNAQFGGLLGLLDFRRESIIRLLEQGYQEAIHHDCEVNGCILADSGTSNATNTSINDSVRPTV